MSLKKILEYMHVCGMSLGFEKAFEPPPRSISDCITQRNHRSVKRAT